MASRAHAQDRFPRVQFHGELQAPPGFHPHALVAVGVSLDGPIAIWSWRDGDAELYASPPWTSSTTALAAYAWTDVAPATVVHVPMLPAGRLLVDVLADGSFLVVGARCGWTESGPELTALAIDQDGRIIRRGCLGDAIAHLQVAGDGTIWAGYSDEGVSGNLAWGRGCGGILAWSPDFEMTWEYDYLGDEGFVGDCYALNVGPGEVLACPYTDFPVVRIQDGQVRVIPTSGVSGPSGIVASGDRVGLIGSYDDPSLLIIGAIQDGVFRESERTHLRAPDGAPLPGSQVQCRGSVAHFFAGGKWYSFDLHGVG